MKYTLKEALKRAREKAGLTQKELSEQFVTGENKDKVTLKTVKNWEQGKAAPSLPTLIDLSEFYNSKFDDCDCELDYLVGRIECRNRDLQFIHDYTGLSEKSILLLHKYHVSKTDGQNCLPTYISNILDHPDCSVLLHHIKTYIGASFLSGVLGSNTDIMDAEESRSANLWRISNKLTHIIEDLGREHYNKFGSERSHERSR